MSCKVTTICNLNANKQLVIIQVSPLPPLLLKTLFTGHKPVYPVYISMKSLIVWRNAPSAFLYAGKKTTFIYPKDLTPVNCPTQAYKH